MISLKPVTESDFYEIIRLKVADEDAHFIAPNVQSLAECWLYRENGDVFPFAIYYDNQLVGFALIDCDDEQSTYMIWRLMIGFQYQGQGYGKQAILALMDMAERQGYATIRADYVKTNEKMSRLLQEIGFQIVGEDERETWTIYDLRKNKTWRKQ